MKRWIKSAILSVLSCIILFTGFPLFVKYRCKYEINRTLTSEAYISKLAVIKNHKIDSSSIVFIGNSLVDNFDLSLFNDLRLVNQGISGDFTSGLISRINPVIEKHPAKMFIEIGINDLIEKVSYKTIIDNYDTILTRIERMSPKTKIYVHSLFPTRKGSIMTPMAKVNQKVIRFNVLLKELTEKRKATYINTWGSFALKDNSMNPELTNDGIHLTREGYRIWAGLIKSLVK